jgi:glycosyltransferase involved in cell wall biosynthesis
MRPTEGFVPHRDTVVFISMSRVRGGPARSLLTVLANLSQDLDRVLFAPIGDPAAHATRAETINAHLPMPYGLRIRQLGRLKAALMLARYVRRHRRHVVAIHANGQTDLNIAALAMLVARVPVVMWAHTSRASPTAGILGWFWRRQRRLVTWLAVSDTARATLADTLGIDHSTIQVVMNPIDPADVVGERDCLDPAGTGNERGPAAKVRVAYLGRALPDKGFDLLADVVRKLVPGDVGLDLYTAPHNPHLPLEPRPAWEDLAAASTEYDIRLHGRVSDVRRAYGHADIVLCPSRQESFNRVAAEAMANGLPVVASDIPAHWELVGEPGAGLLFPVGDAAAAAAAIARLADDAALRHELGIRGREHVQRFGPGQIVPQLEARYRAAPGTPGAG